MPSPRLCRTTNFTSLASRPPFPSPPFLRPSSAHCSAPSASAALTLAPRAPRAARARACGAAAARPGDQRGMIHQGRARRRQPSCCRAAGGEAAPPPRRRSHAACCPAPPVALVIRPLNLSGPLFLFLSFLFFSSTFLTLIVFSSLASGGPVLGMCLPALFPARRRLVADAPPLGGEGPDSPISTDGARAPALRPRSRVAAVGDSLVAGGARGRTKAPEADGPEPPAPAPRRISAATVRTRAAALRTRPRPTALTRIIIMAGRSPTRRAAHFLMIRSQCLTLPPAPRRCRLRLLLYFSLHVNSLDVPLWRRRWSWQAPRARA